MQSRYASFKPETLQFLRELTANNNREWFKSNKDRYDEQVLDVALRFIQSMQDPLARIAPSFTAVPTRIGGSLMRVYRDTRFSKNKQPYKTNIGIQFRHELAKDVHSPGYYVHIEPEQAFIAMGMWRPESDALRGIRERIVARPGEWKRLRQDASFRRNLSLQGESLVRAPKGFDAEHELIEDIRRKSFIAVRDIEAEDCLKPRFQQTVESTFQSGESLMRFLCASVGVPF